MKRAPLKRFRFISILTNRIHLWRGFDTCLHADFTDPSQFFDEVWLVIESRLNKLLEKGAVDGAHGAILDMQIDGELSKACMHALEEFDIRSRFIKELDASAVHSCETAIQSFRDELGRAQELEDQRCAVYQAVTGHEPKYTADLLRNRFDERRLEYQSSMLESSLSLQNKL